MKQNKQQLLGNLEIITSTDKKAIDAYKHYLEVSVPRMDQIVTWGLIPGSEHPVLAGVGVPGVLFEVNGIGHQGVVVVLNRIPGEYSIMFLDKSNKLVRFMVQIPDTALIDTLDREITGGATLAMRLSFLERTQPQLADLLMAGKKVIIL